MHTYMYRYMQGERQRVYKFRREIPSSGKLRRVAFTRDMPRNIPENGIPHSQLHKNLKSYQISSFTTFSSKMLIVRLSRIWQLEVSECDNFICLLGYLKSENFGCIVGYILCNLKVIGGFRLLGCDAMWML
jgi:hypothetical protein